MQDGRLSVVTAASGDVITLADAKVHLRVDHDDEDDYITGLIEAAVSEVDSPEGWLGRSLLTKTLRLTLDSPPPTVIRLPGPPIQSIDSVTYRDTDGTFQTITDYEEDLTAEPGLIWAKKNTFYGIGRWPSDMEHHGPDLFRVEYTAGYGAESDIPRIIKQWLLTRVGDMYRDREGTILGTNQSELTHVKRALDNMRVR